MRGIPIRLHASLVLIIPFLAVVFARQLDEVEGSASPTVMGIVVAVALFASVLLHELAHCLIALRLGGHVRGITLMFLGGLSELDGLLEPRREVLVASAGPLASLGIGGAVLAVAPHLGPAAPAVQLIGALNIVLGVFNLVPAFPLDGGRIVRALLALRYGRVRATRFAGIVGRLIAVAIGAIGAIWGDFMLLFVAGFIYVGAQRETAGVEDDEAQTGVSHSGYRGFGPETVSKKSS